jgi:protein transport protein SEC61 subunit gamma-like protein
MDIVDKSREVQKDIEDRTRRLGKGKYGRVLKMARKPSNDEFIRVIEVTGLGLILIGGLGFLIYLLWISIPGLFS